VNIGEATQSYEAWMRTCCPVIEADISLKHKQMREDSFMFFRGTFYRWAQLWPELCGELAKAPKVLAVADLHVGSFGTWRDIEGRLCWGVDDFDECYSLAYTNDLVRLATSIRMVTECEQLSIGSRAGCEAILEGYMSSLKKGGEPFVLAERDQTMERLGVQAFKPAADFWEKLRRLPAATSSFPSEANAPIQKTLPDPKLKYKVSRRRAGMGSLGQERFAALALYNGGWIAREIKALVPSSCMWAEGHLGNGQSYYNEAIASAVRSHDPYQRVIGKWLTRRLSPDSNPIEILDLPKERDEETLLHAMGAEAANVHLGSTRRIKRILEDLRKRKPNWLRSAAKVMSKAVIAEWREYRKA